MRAVMYALHVYTKPCKNANIACFRAVYSSKTKVRYDGPIKLDLGKNRFFYESEISGENKWFAAINKGN